MASSHIARRTLTTILTRSRSRSALALLQTTHLHPTTHTPPHSITQTRSKTTGPGYSPLNDPSPNWTNRPPRETILLDGCDYEHWLIVMEFPTESKPSPDQMVDTYVKTLAQVLGSEEEARKKIYSVCTTTYTGFGALISEELSYKVKGIPGVLWVLPDSYLDVPNKDYGGDLFVDGKVIRRPQYDFSDRQPPSRTRSRARPDRRRDRVQNVGRPPLQALNQSWAHNQPPTTQHPTTIDNQNAPLNQGQVPSAN